MHEAEDVKGGGPTYREGFSSSITIFAQPLLSSKGNRRAIRSESAILTGNLDLRARREHNNNGGQFRLLYLEATWLAEETNEQTTSNEAASVYTL